MATNNKPAGAATRHSKGSKATSSALGENEVLENSVLKTNHIVAQQAQASDDFVAAMHTTSGLITELDGGVSISEAQAQILQYIQSQ